MVSRFVRCWPLLLACGLALVWPALAALQDPVQETLLRSQRRINGVVVRENQNYFVIASATGVEKFRRAEVAISGKVLSEAYKVDQLLSIAEGNIVNREFDRLEGKLQPLDDAIAAFARYLEQYYPNPMVSDDRKKAMAEALKYYQETRRQIEPTIAALKLVREVEDLHRDFNRKALAPDQALLLRLADQQTRLNANVAATPLAAKDRERAVLQLGDVVRETLMVTTRDALHEYRQQQVSRSLVSLAAVLRQVQAVLPGAAEAQAELAAAVVGQGEARLKQIPDLAEAAMRFGAEVQVNDQAYREAQPGIAEVSALIVALVPEMVGAKAESQRQALEALRERLAQANVAAQARLQLFRQLGSDYRLARTTFASRDFPKAMALFQAVADAATAAKLPVPAFALEAQDKAQEAEANWRFNELRRAESLNAEELTALQPLAEDCQKRLAVSFPRYGIRPADYQLGLEQVATAVRFHKAFARLQEAVAKDPVLAWSFIHQMQARLDEDKPTLLAHLAQTWERYRATHEGPVADRAAKVLLDRTPMLQDESDHQLLLGLCEHYLRVAAVDRAQALTRRALANLKEQPQPKLQQDLLQLELRIASAYAELEQFDKVSDIHQFLADEHPGYLKQGRIQDQVAAQLERRAVALARSGELARAAELYRKLALDYPATALERQVHHHLLELQLKLSGTSGTVLTEPLLTQYNTFIGEFPLATEQLRGPQAARGELLKTFQTEWELEPIKATENLLALAQKFPHFSQGVALMAGAIDYAAGYGGGLLRASERPAPAMVTTAMLRLLHPDYRELSASAKLQDVYVQLRLRLARNLVEVRKLSEAFDIFNEVKNRFPEMAAKYGVIPLMEEYRWNLRKARLERPLQLRLPLDWLALLCWPLFWLWRAYRARVAGRNFRRPSYYYSHLAVQLLVFGVLGWLLLSSSVGHFSATLLALLLPELAYHAVGCFSYRFFPRIYAGRRLAAERWLLRVAGGALPGNLSENLRQDVARLEEDLPLVDDYERYRIERAYRLARGNPRRAYESLQALLAEYGGGAGPSPETRNYFVATLGRLGELACRLGEDQQARLYLEQHLELEPKDRHPRELLAELYYQRQDYEAAIPHLKVLLAAFGASDELWRRLGRACFETAKYQAASKCFETLTQPTRDDQFLHARSHAFANEYDQTVDKYQALLKNNPADSEAIYYLASFLAQCNEDAKALKVLSLIKSDDQRFHPRSLCLQGRILLRNDKYDDAAELFQQALRVDATLLVALLGLGQARVLAGQKEAATEQFQLVLAREPKNPLASYYQGIIEETRDPVKAVFLLGQACAAPQLARDANRRLGRLAFFANAYAKAIEHFQQAEDAGEHASWFLYFYAYALAMQKQMVKCEQELVKILGRRTEDADWRDEAGKAMYTIGMKLFELRQFRLAYQCFEYVREHTSEAAQLSHLALLLEETRFRQVIEHIAAGDYLEAENAVAMLQLETHDKDRFTACQYYQALCQLFLKQYPQALKVVEALAAGDKENPRYLYARMVAFMGMNQEGEANELLSRLRDLATLPPHLRVGLSTARAYMSARVGKLNRAEQILDKIPELSSEFPSAPYLRHKVAVTRVYYLCLLNDTARLEELMKDMTEREKGQAAYYHALAALVTQETESAYQILRPHAGFRERNQRLFLYLATYQAAAAFLRGDISAARSYLTGVDGPAHLETVRLALACHDALDQMRPADLESVTSAMRTLREHASQLADKHLAHSVTHSLGVLHLRRAILLEESVASLSDCQQAWEDALAFWETQVLGNREFWNLEQERFALPGQAQRPFANNELDAINAKFKAETLVAFFRGYFLAHLLRADAPRSQMHLSFLQNLGQRDGMYKTYMVKLLEEMEGALRRLDRLDPRYDTWDFLLLTVRLQATIKRAIETPDEALEAQVTAYEQLSLRFERPSELQRERRNFNTNLLNALQEGIRGNYSVAGERLESCLRNIPPGTHLDTLTGGLRMLREGCRNPAAYASAGKNLTSEFERLYAKVRDANISRGSDHARTA